MAHVGAWIALLYQGRAVADPTAWARGQVNVNMLYGALVAIVELLRGYGVQIALTSEQLSSIALDVLVVFNAVAGAAGHSAVGLPNGAAPASPARDVGKSGSSAAPVDDPPGFRDQGGA